MICGWVGRGPPIGWRAGAERARGLARGRAGRSVGQAGGLARGRAGERVSGRAGRRAVARMGGRARVPRADGCRARARASTRAGAGGLRACGWASGRKMAQWGWGKVEMRRERGNPEQDIKLL